MKTFLDIGYSNGIFWRCVGNPTDAPGQACTKVPTFEVVGLGLVICLVILIAVILTRRRRHI
jgi:hypothetical protein